MNRREFIRMGLASGALSVFAPATACVSSNPGTATAPLLPFDAQTQDQTNSFKKKVFAHWHFFPTSINNMPPAEDYYTREYMQPEGEHGKYLQGGGYIRERPLPRPPSSSGSWRLDDMVDEIRLASNIGIDAFQVNIGSITSNGASWILLKKMLDASQKASNLCKAFPCLDIASNLRLTSPGTIVNALTSIADHPGLMRTDDGRMYLSAFCAENWSAPQWSDVLEGLKANGVQIYFFPVFLDLNHATKEQLELADLISVWGANRFSLLPGLNRRADQFQKESKGWCQPVCPQDFRPKNNWYAEAENSRLFRESWNLALNSEPAAVNIVTWNDYSEGTEIRPSTGIQYAFYDLASYYIAAFKSGSLPSIRRDVLYYFHRVQPASANNASTDKSANTKNFELKWGGQPDNEIELVGFLTSPGRLTIRTDKGDVSANCQGGVVSIRAPLTPGIPSFILERHGKTVIEFSSAFPISNTITRVDLLYRAGSSNRPSVVSR